MNHLCNQQEKTLRGLVRGKCALMIFAFFVLGGCGIWNGYLDSDYESSRADRLCHPYGQCAQGTWVAIDPMGKDPQVAKRECEEAVAQRYGDSWWADSVARGLEIGRCMENQGFTLQQ